MFRTNHTNSLCHGKKQCCITNQQLFELDGLKNNLMTKEYVDQHCSKGHGLNSKDLVVRWRLVWGGFKNGKPFLNFLHSIYKKKDGG